LSMSRISSSDRRPGEEVERQGNDVDVARSLSVPEESALHAIGAGEDAQLGRSDGGATIVVRMQRQDDTVAPVHISKEPLDGIGVEIGREHLDGAGRFKIRATRARDRCSMTALQTSTA